MASTIEVFADITCPFTHVGLKQVVRHVADMDDPVDVVVRAWPLEWVNGAPLDVDAVMIKAQALDEQLGVHDFAGLRADRWPATTIPALNLVASAYERDAATGLAVSLELRAALFEHGVDIGDQRRTRTDRSRPRSRTPGHRTERCRATRLRRRQGPQACRDPRTSSSAPTASSARRSTSARTRRGISPPGSTAPCSPTSSPASTADVELLDPSLTGVGRRGEDGRGPPGGIDTKSTEPTWTPDDEQMDERRHSAERSCESICSVGPSAETIWPKPSDRTIWRGTWTSEASSRSCCWDSCVE